MLTLTIKSLTGKRITVDVSPDAVVEDIKSKIFDKEGIPVNVQKLYLQPPKIGPFGRPKGTELGNRKSLTEYGITENTMLYMLLPMARSGSSEAMCAVS